MRHTFEDESWVDLIPLSGIKYKNKMRYGHACDKAVRLNDEEEVDKATIRTEPGGWIGYIHALSDTRYAALVASVVEKWSYDVPVPEITPDGTVLHAESAGEANLELQDLLEPYREKLTREPDPKGTTTGSSSKSSKAKDPASPTA